MAFVFPASSYEMTGRADGEFSLTETTGCAALGICGLSGLLSLYQKIRPASARPRTAKRMSGSWEETQLEPVAGSAWGELALGGWELGCVYAHACACVTVCLHVNVYVYVHILSNMCVCMCTHASI